MERVIRFNAIDDSLEDDFVETDWTVIDRMYLKTNKGPEIAALIWKDTLNNRHAIEKIKEIKKERKKIVNELTSRCYQLLNTKEG